MTILHELTIKSFYEGLINKKFKALEIVQAFLNHIKEKDSEIGAYLSLNEDNAIKQAEEIDLKIARGEEINILSGVPLAIKDNILIKGIKATAASKILENYIASYDATVIKKLKGKGSVFLGKTNLDEFAMGSSTENSAFKITRNPHDPQRVPGGSSGGSAAAVAGHMAIAALGSDTGGSIRQPASFCGVVGLKPTYGAVSRFGLIAMASSLDQIGPITKTVEDAAILFEAISGKDKFDATSINLSPDFSNEILNPQIDYIKNLTVGIPKEYFIEGLDQETQTAMDLVIDNLKKLGLKIKEISLPHTQYALSTYYIIMPAEVSSNLARFDGIRYSREKQDENLLNLYLKNKALFGKETKRRIILGTFVLSSGYYDAYYRKAQEIRTLIKKDFDIAFQDVDVILTPVSPNVAFKFGEKKDPIAMYLSDIFTIPVNLAGLPAISIPAKNYHLTKELPVGFQLIGKYFKEKDILGIGKFYEKLFEGI
jgi:aspartyl-tRNA(Asn)/glutamyl-tRNA(Gln) amidotransferase subunit A